MKDGSFLKPDRIIDCHAGWPPVRVSAYWEKGKKFGKPLPQPAAASKQGL
jgi:hypothetical protein